MSFNAKNLAYDSKEPAFLQRLRSQFGNSSGGLERPSLRPRRVHDDKDDDAPTYVDAESNEVISKEDYEAMVKCGDSETKQPKDGEEDEDAVANQDGDSQKAETAIMKQNLAEIGGPRKRKQAKVVGDEVEGDDVEGVEKEEFSKSQDFVRSEVINERVVLNVLEVKYFFLSAVPDSEATLTRQAFLDWKLPRTSSFVAGQTRHLPSKMPVVSVEDLIRLQRKPDDIRNICILAHVDHGKTSLTDSLIATNGIISPKLAGKIRYLDSRPDEQLRGITMESSAISLFFSMMRRSAPDAQPEAKEYLINLIDSPGHIDFSSEVSTASRLCDGAVVLVDAVEGVCSQTVTVLRQTWVEQLKPILVINKMDRLITELQMTSAEAYSHLSRLLEQVNAVIGSFYQGERMEEDLQWRERMEERVNAAAQQKQAQDGEPAEGGVDGAQYVERDDEDLYFAPEKNNVIFCSAVDGWAFTVRQFAAIYEKKLGIKRAILERVLWGDYYLDPKTKRVLGQKHLKGRALKPMFVQLVLDSVWAAYEATTGGGKGKGDPALLEKITKSLGINIPPYILRSRDPRNIMTTLFSQWLPLSTALLVSVIEYLPSPRTAQSSRLPPMIEESPGSKYVDAAVKDAMIQFKTGPKEPVVAYVSKMVSIPESELSSSKKKTGTMSADEARELARRKREEIAKMQAEASTNQADDFSRVTSAFERVQIDDENQPAEQEQKEDPEHLIGFARLYSGTLSVGDSVYVLPPKFSPENAHASPEPQKVIVTDLYLLMGRSLEPLQSVPAGVVFGIGGLSGHILKTGTLCSQLEGGINLAGVSLDTPPIVRVALEPVNPSDLSKMVTGLRLLEQSDPCALYEVLPNGEHVILTAGELHLERCLKDLRERFAKCEIQTGQTIVPYRETIVRAAEMAAPKNPDLGRGGVLAVSASKQLTVRLKVIPLPEAVTDFFTKHVGTIKRLQSQKRIIRAEGENATLSSESTQQDEAADATGEAREVSLLSLDDFRKELSKTFEEVKEDKELWKDVVDKIIASVLGGQGPMSLSTPQ
ncbi:hypothetical protein AN6907.2 [Aspergillus nidulans FGSC A4]|nr:hypothetical protein AN6907.2 [Aspergillus nidulans FGSC A4]|eukprot:XP_664511.1 hypothetical protein AN6907.2 [Aspergillus nidulans FGSC A4]